jgi:hypothetical protein
MSAKPPFPDRRKILAASVAVAASSLIPAQAHAATTSEAIRPFHVNFPRAELSELRIFFPLADNRTQKYLASSKRSVNCWMLVPYRQRRPNRVSAPDTDERRDVRPLSREPHDWGLFNSTFFIIHWKRKGVPDRNLPAPWSSEEHSAYLMVRDNNGIAAAYVYYENEMRYRAKFPTKEEARRVALNIARLPELLRCKT